MLRYSLHITLMVCLIVVSGFIETEEPYDTCREQGYKSANFEEYYIYTGKSESSFTNRVDVINVAPLDYYRKYKTKTETNFGHSNLVQNKVIEKQKSMSTIVVVSDTLQEKRFRKAFYLVEGEYKTKKVKVPCEFSNDAVLNQKIAKQLTERNYYSGTLSDQMEGELLNAMMKFQADHSLIVGPITKNTISALDINVSELNELRKSTASSGNILRSAPATIPLVTHVVPTEPAQPVDSTQLNVDLSRQDFPQLFSNKQLVVLDSIHIDNPSFEDVPRMGGRQFDRKILGWSDCGKINFQGETPPDIHPTYNSAWDVTKSAKLGDTYLGMVVRDNDSWEGVGQQLETPLKKGKCYMMSVYLNTSETYVSATRTSGAIDNYNEPIIVRVWGASEQCQYFQPATILTQSEPIESDAWQEHVFQFVPNVDSPFVIVEAYYQMQSNLPYNGHVLLDAMSQIYEVECE